MGRRTKIIEKMGTQKVYLINDLREIVMKSVPGPKLGIYFKNRKGEEFPIQFIEDLVLDTLMRAHEITEKEYEEFGKS